MKCEFRAEIFILLLLLLYNWKKYTTLDFELISIDAHAAFQFKSLT